MTTSNKYSFEKFYGKGVFIDTELLIVLLIGAYKRSLIGQGCTANYTLDDYNLLYAFLSKFKYKYVSQPILTEAFFHLFEGNKKIEKGYQEEFIKDTLDILVINLNESYSEKKFTLENKRVIDLGFADINSVECCLKNDLLLLTKDAGLCRYANEKELEYVSFDYLRELAGFFD